MVFNAYTIHETVLLTHDRYLHTNELQPDRLLFQSVRFYFPSHFARLLYRYRGCLVVRTVFVGERCL